MLTKRTVLPKLPENTRPSYLPPKPKQSGRKFDNKMYHTSRWRKLRATKIAANPLCEICEKEGIVTEARVADHIENVSSGTTEAQREGLMWNYSNLQSVCDSCHNRKSGTEAHKKDNEKYI